MGLKVAVTTEYLVQSRNSLGKAVYSSLFNSEYAEIYAWALIMILLILTLTGVPAVIIRGLSDRNQQRRHWRLCP